MTIGQNMRRIREERRESQADLAELLQTTRQQISKYETDQQELPARRIIELCNHWGVSADELLGLNR